MATFLTSPKGYLQECSMFYHCIIPFPTKMGNQQPIEKLDRTSESLDIHSIFHTIQGEGPFCGRSAVFVRLAGCNLQCPACDTDYTIGRTRMDVPHILSQVKSKQPSPNLVVITGGEPLRQNITYLVQSLIANGYVVQIETNGTVGLDPQLWEFVRKDPALNYGLFIVVSPKTGKINESLYPHIAAYKYVAHHRDMDEDGLPRYALNHTAHPRLARPHKSYKGPVYLQPCDSKNKVENKRNLDACVKSVMTFGYTLQLQIHKIIGVE